MRGWSGTGRRWTSRQRREPGRAGVGFLEVSPPVFAAGNRAETKRETEVHSVWVSVSHLEREGFCRDPNKEMPII